MKESVLVSSFQLYIFVSFYGVLIHMFMWTNKYSDGNELAKSY